MILILLIIFFYQIWCCILADEEREVEYWEGLFEKFKEGSGIQVD